MEVWARCCAALEHNQAGVVSRLVAIGVATFIGLSFIPAFAQDSSIPAVVWFTDHRNLVQVDPKSDQTTLNLAIPYESSALAVDPTDGSVWLLGSRQLQKYDRTGVFMQAIDLRSLSTGLGEAKQLLLNPHDSSLWLAGERTVLRLNADGSLAGGTKLTDSVRSITLDMDDHLWVITERQLLRLSPSLTIQAAQSLQSMLASPRYVAVDRLGSRVWIAGQTELVAVATDNLAQPLARIALTSAARDRSHLGTIEALAVHPVYGTVWAATRQALHIHDRLGRPLTQVPLASYDLGEIEAMTFDPVEFGLWIGGKRALGHFRGTGDFVARIPLQNELEALAASPFQLRPTLSLLAPADKTVTNNAFTPLRYGLTSDCTGTPCYLEPDYTRSLVFDVNVDGQAVGSLFTLGSYEATYSPSSRWPDGIHRIEAEATDRFGHRSEKITSSFTIDTVPPQFLSVTPPNGSFFGTPGATIGGNVNEAGANVTLSRNGAFLSMGGANFGFAVTLLPGPNAFELTATDPAGNSSRTVLTLVFDNIPPTIPNTGLITIDYSIDGVASVTGTAGAVEGGAKVTIRNQRTGETVTVTANANGSFTARLAAQPGDQLAITAKDAAGNSSQAAQVTVPGSPGGGLPPNPSIVAPPLDPTVVTQLATATAFLYSGSNPIQTGVVAGAIEPRRVAVMRGQVAKLDGTPLPGVTISILNHPEFGQTLTRADGMFDLAVNGGGVLTIDYRKSGYLPAQRQLDTPWRDYVIAPDVVMIPLDSQVTTINLGVPSVQVARGSPVTDADGSRRATLLINPGTTANLVMANGSMQAVATLNIRATEYTVGTNGPKAMPAPLPPTSGYTYAVELSADEAIAAGASSVTFSQPVYHYVENFLGFPVGQRVPAGYYDRTKGAWVPSDSGRVIKILSTAGGIAALDANGDGNPDNAAELAALGVSNAERIQLASLYPADTSLWRVPITHFTPLDYNWPYGPPDDAVEPDDLEPERDEQEPDPCKQQGSIIECQNQVLGERVPIVGTTFSLHYQSDRVPGRTAAHTLNISLSGSTVPPSLKRIELRVEVAGRIFNQSFPAAPNQKYVFTWDGKDGYGRPVYGQQPVSVTLGYVYPLVYLEPADFQRNFAAISGIPMNSVRTSRELTLYQIWKQSIGTIGLWDARGQGLGGWSLSELHTYDPNGRVLHLGDGRRRTDQSGVGASVNRVAGGGYWVHGFGGDGGPATAARLEIPFDVAAAPDGTLYIADTSNNRIRRVSPNGIISTFAGNGSLNFNGDGGPATRSSIGSPFDVAVGPDGSVYIADRLSQRIRRVTPDGLIDTVAGKGLAGFSGDGGPATEAELNYPGNVAIAPDGTIYINDGGNHRIRKVSPDGFITTVAGTGVRDSTGDGGPAALATFDTVRGMALGPDGSLYLADMGANRIRRISPDGIISTVAGNNQRGFLGDGGPATAAALRDPWDVTVGSEGEIYIADTGNNRIRRVSPSGIISTYAGNGDGGFGDDTGPATAARFRSPAGVTIGPDQNVYIAASGDYAIQKVASAFPRFSLDDILLPSEDAQQIYVMSTDGRHKRTVNALTGANQYVFGYEPSGRLATITDADGNVTRIERGSSGTPTAIVAPDGQRTALALDSNGYLARIENPAGESHAMVYTTGGLLTSFQNPRGHVSQITYDDLGRLFRDQNPAGGSWTLGRSNDTTGHTSTLTSALNRTATYRVDELPTGERRWRNTRPDGTAIESLFKTDGAVVATAPDGAVSTTVIGPDPRFGMLAPVPGSTTIRTPGGLTSTTSVTRVATLSDPANLLSLVDQTETTVTNGRTRTRAYNAAGRTYTDTSAAGRQVVTVVDAQGRLTKEQTPGLAEMNLAYDARGRLVSFTQGSGAGGRITQFGYDAQGNLESISDALGGTERFAFDPAGRVTQQTLTDGRVIRLGYDANGNITNVTPPGRPAHGFGFTAVDLEEAYTPPVVTGVPVTTTQYAYNLDKQLTRITRPDGQTIGLAYDAGGRIASRTIPDGTITHGYHASTGQTASINSSKGINLGYSYDGPLLRNESWTGPVAGTVSRNYNSDLLVSAIDVNGTNIVFGYDDDGLLTQAGDLALTRDGQNGLLIGTALGSVSTSQSYNEFGETSQFSATQGGANLLTVAYARDKLGRIAEKTETLLGELPVTLDYRYDLAGRLTEVRRDGTIQATYGYDANGNRLSRSANGATSSGTYDDQDRLLSYGNNSYTYSANGELQTKASGGQTTTYTYDVIGNLTGVSLPGGATIEYLIDGQDRRIGKKVNGVSVQGFLYQDRLKPVAELDGSGNVVARFVYGAMDNVPEYLIKGSTAYRIISDHLGSPRLIVNTGNGNVEQRLDYDEFGNVTLDSNPGFQPFGFAGGLYDRDTRLVRFGARDYDPETGRWTVKDPIRFDGWDSNLYGYVNGNPVRWVDPSGLAATTKPVIPAAVRDYLLKSCAQAPESCKIIGKKIEIDLGVPEECSKIPKDYKSNPYATRGHVRIDFCTSSPEEAVQVQSPRCRQSRNFPANHPQPIGLRG